MEIYQKTALIRAVARLFEDVEPGDVFDVCMTLAAVNDVINGSPAYALENGANKIASEIYYASLVAEGFMSYNQRVPTMGEMIDARRCDIERRQRTPFRLQLN